MYRFYKITKNQDGIDHPSVDPFEDVNIAEGNFEFQKGLAMEEDKFAFLMLLDNNGEIHKSEKGEVYLTTIGDGTIRPRLFEVKTTAEKEDAKSYPHDTAYEVSADFYKRMGGAKQNVSVIAEMLRGIDENGRPLEYEYWVRINEETPVDEATPVEPSEG